MDRQTLDQRLRADADANRFKVVGDYLVFDKNSNLDYLVLTDFKLKELLTKNPVSHTKLNLNLLAKVDSIRETLGRPVTVRASYHSPEYHLTSFGAHDSDLYTSGDAISLGIEPNHLEELITSVKANFTPGEIGLYSWGVHLGWSKVPKEWDTRNDLSFNRKFKNLISNDFMKNLLLLGGSAAAVWFFFFKRK